jgi:hypothetical protein
MAMEDEYLKIPLDKVIGMILEEERQKIRRFYKETGSQAMADLMDVYPVTESELLKLFTR